MITKDSFTFLRTVNDYQLSITYDEYQGNPLEHPLHEYHLIIRTYQFNSKLDFMAGSFWLEYNLIEKSFLQRPDKPELMRQLNKGLRPELLQYLVNEYRIERVSLLDDSYDVKGEKYPAGSFQDHLYLISWLEEIIQTRVNIYLPA